MNSFLEKLILLLIGSMLTYYFSFKLMNQCMTLDNDSVDDSVIQNIEIECNKKLILNKYERLLANDVIPKDKLNTKLEDIAGYDEVKNKLLKLIVNPYNNNSKYVQKGLIFHGPPGTGKTLFAKSLACNLNSVFINFNVSTIENKMYGESSKLLKALFTFAEKVDACTIFIDELDGFASHRSSMDQHHTTCLKTQFLTLVDGILDKRSKLFIVGATNKLNNIDKAVQRRLFLHIKIDLPNILDIHNILILYFDKYEIPYEDDEISSISEQCVGYSCSDINEIVKLVCLKNETFDNIDVKFKDCLKFLNEHKNTT